MIFRPGYATFDYDDAGWEQADIVRLDVMVNGEAGWAGAQAMVSSLDFEASECWSRF
jgi:translation elongation factor EF-4